MLNYQFDWSIITSGKYFDWLVSGLFITLKLSSISIVLAFILGLRDCRHAYGPQPPDPLVRPRLPGVFSQYAAAGADILLVFRLIYKILPTIVNDWLNTTGFEFAAAAIALTIYTSAFIAEDIRSGILSIPKEQMEAARSAGFSYLSSMQYIILPQAVRITVPPLVNQFLNVVKNSSLAMTIGVMEITYQARQVESYTFKGFEAFTAATVVYLTLSLVITALVNLYNEKVLNVHKAS